MMNKDEAVRELSKVTGISVAYAEDLYDSFFPKPVVPQFVADWYEGNKDDFEVNLFQCIGEAVEDYDSNSSSKFEDWLMSDDTEVIKTLVNMHQFGYEVEEEKRYTVKLKNKNGHEDYLVDTNSGGFRFYNNLYAENRIRTRKELEANGFGWVFDCPGVEVKEAK